MARYLERWQALIGMEFDVDKAFMVSQKFDDIQQCINCLMTEDSESSSIETSYITQNAHVNVKLSEWMWYKHDEHSEWMKGFVVVSDSVILIYNGRNAFKSCYHPLHIIILSTTTEYHDGNDMVVLQEWLAKKGKMKWSNRWCTLRRDGYLDYIDRRDNVKSIDFYKAEFILKTNNNTIQWTNYIGELIQFRFPSDAMQQKWHYRMLQIQKTCMELRKTHKKYEQKTLFGFTVLQRHTSKTYRNSINVEEHYFCCYTHQQLEIWKKCINDERAQITMKRLKEKYLSTGDGDKGKASIQFKMVLNRVGNITKRRNDSISNHSNDNGSILESMSDEIGKYKKQKRNGNKLKLIFSGSSDVDKTMKHLIQQIHSDTFDSVQIMEIYINRIHGWFFGDIDHIQNDMNTESVIEYIFDSNNDLFFKLFASITYLKLDGRKRMTQIIKEIIKYFGKEQCQRFFIDVTNDEGYNPLIQIIFDKFDVNSNGILMELINQSELINMLLNTLKIHNKNTKTDIGFIDILLELMGNRDLVISSSSFKTLYCLLTTKNKKSQKYITEYLDNNYEDIFIAINKMMKYENCLLQKYSLRLLSAIFSFESNYSMMMIYIDNKQNLENCINLIQKYHNNSISFAAWNVFKLFIYNNIRKIKVQSIIFNNKHYLIDLLNKLDANKACDQEFIKERDVVINSLLNYQMTI